MIVVSMGTGTSFIRVDGDSIEHLGGMAIGGGTLQGLSRILFKTHDIRHVMSMAMRGDVSAVDLQIKDISRTEIPGLPYGVTASNFGKAEANAEPDDVAAGIINMILQAIGSAANFVARNTGIKDFVLIGNLSMLPQCRPTFDRETVRDKVPYSGIQGVQDRARSRPVFPSLTPDMTDCPVILSLSS